MKWVAGDLHLGYEWTEKQLARISSFQSLIHPDDIVIYAGDIFEYAWHTREEVASSLAFEPFMNGLEGRCHFLSGNHDYSPTLPEYWHGDGITVWHGHQFDLLADSAWKRW